MSRSFAILCILLASDVANALQLVEAISAENVVGRPDFLRQDKVAYSVDRGGRVDILIRDAALDKVYRYASHPLDDRSPAFSPAGDSLAWIAQRNDVKGDIYLGKLPIDRRPQRITDGRLGVESFSWSPSGDSIAFVTRDPFMNQRKGYIHEISSGARKEISISVSKWLGGCREDEWFVVDDHRTRSSIGLYDAVSDESHNIWTFNGLIYDVSLLDCDARQARLYVSFGAQGASGSDAQISLAVVTVDRQFLDGRYQQLIGRSLPRLDLSRVGDQVVGRSSTVSRRLVALNTSQLSSFSVADVGLQDLGGLDTNEQLDVVAAKEAVDLFSQDEADFYRFLIQRRARRASAASELLNRLWDTGCKEAQKIAGIYLRRSETAASRQCGNAEIWKTWNEFAKADLAMMSGSIAVASSAYQQWIATEPNAFVRYIGLTRWTRMMTWLDPIDAALQVIEQVGKLGIVLRSDEKTWLFDHLLEPMNHKSFEELDDLAKRWPTIRDPDHLAHSLIVMNTARRWAQAGAWSEAASASQTAGRSFESPDGRFQRHVELTQWMLLSGAPRQSLKMLQKLENDYPERTEVLGKLRTELRTSLTETALQAEREGDASKAYALYSQLLILEPDDTEITRRMLAQAGPAGFLNDRLQGYYQAVRRDTRSWFDHYVLGLALSYGGPSLFEWSEKELRKALELQPQSADATQTLAWVLLNRDPDGADVLKRAEEVVDIVERILSRIDEDNIRYQELEQSLSVALYRLGKYDRAEAILGRYESSYSPSTPGYSAYLSLRADLSYQSGRFSESLSWLKMLFDAERDLGSPRDLAELEARLGVVHYASGEVENAIERFEASLKRYSTLDAARKTEHLGRILSILKGEDRELSLDNARELNVWKWSLRGVSRTLFIAATTSDSGAAARSEESEAELLEGGDEEEKIDATPETLGETLSPYGDEFHWLHWSHASSAFNQAAYVLAVPKMESALRNRIAALQSIWSDGVLGFFYVQEVRDLIFDALAIVRIAPQSDVMGAIRQLTSAMSDEARMSEQWRQVSLELEEHVTRHAYSAPDICSLRGDLFTDSRSTLPYLCGYLDLATKESPNLARDVEDIDQFISTRTTDLPESQCEPTQVFSSWKNRGYLPSDNARVARLMARCPALDAWEKAELLIGLEWAKEQLSGLALADDADDVLSSEQLSEAVVWVLDEELLYAGAIRSGGGWWYLEIGDGRTLVRFMSSQEVISRLQEIGPRRPLLSLELTALVETLNLGSYDFARSLVRKWEIETWEGLRHISVPESTVMLSECREMTRSPFSFETLMIRMNSSAALDEVLIELEMCLRDGPEFYQVVVEYEESPATMTADFYRIGHLFRDVDRFPISSLLLISPEREMRLGPPPPRGLAWVRAWDEQFRPLFNKALASRQRLAKSPSPQAHTHSIALIESAIETLDALEFTDQALIQSYLGQLKGPPAMLAQIYPRLDLFRTKFLIWAIVSYEAVKNLSKAEQILGRLLENKSWGSDLAVFSRWSRKRSQLLIALDEPDVGFEVLEFCWGKGIVDCGVVLGEKYLSDARYRDAERIADGLVARNGEVMANVQGMEIKARIAEQERYDFDSAIELLFRANALSADMDLESRVRIYVHLIRVARLGGDYAASEQVATNVLLWDLNDKQRLQVELSLAQTWYVAGRARKVMREMPRLTKLAEESGQRFTRMLCTSLWALSSLELGRWDDAVTLAESALKQAEALGNRREIANQLNNLGLIYARTGEFQRADDVLNRAMTSDFSSRDSLSLAYSMRNLGQQRFLAGNHKAAASLLEEATFLSTSAGDRINSARGQLSLLLNREALGDKSLGDLFWALAEESKELRLKEIQWRALFGAYRFYKVSLNVDESLVLLKEIFELSMSQDGLSSERIGPGRESLRNEYHRRLVEARRMEDALEVALVFAQPRSVRGQRAVLGVTSIQERLKPGELLWYGWFDQKGWQGWLISGAATRFVATDWAGADTSKLFDDLDARLRELAPLGTSLTTLSRAFDYLMGDSLDSVTTLKILDAPSRHWVPYRALSLGDGLLDERVALEWVLPLIGEQIAPTDAVDSPTLWVTAHSDDLPFAKLERDWFVEKQVGQEISFETIFEEQRQSLHVTGHYDGLGALESAWFASGRDASIRWPKHVFMNTCGPAGAFGRTLERLGGLVTALSNGTEVAVSHRLRISDWAAAVLAKRFYASSSVESAAKRAQRATRFVRQMFAHPAHWAGLEVVKGL